MYEIQYEYKKHFEYLLGKFDEVNKNYSTIRKAIESPNTSHLSWEIKGKHVSDISDRVVKLEKLKETVVSKQAKLQEYVSEVEAALSKITIPNGRDAMRRFIFTKGPRSINGKGIAELKLSPYEYYDLYKAASKELNNGTIQ